MGRARPDSKWALDGFKTDKPTAEDARSSWHKEMAGDPEIAHGVQDAVMTAVVDAVLDRNYKRARAIAEVADEILSMDFTRWYA